MPLVSPAIEFCPQASLETRLATLARNLWWTWQPDVIETFRAIDPGLWEAVGHSPLGFLANLPAEALAERAKELDLETRVAAAETALAVYLDRHEPWAERHCGMLRVAPVAYFSPEFALHESLPIYSGGLGVLAGDHLKAASDLGIPIVGIGLLYSQGYFRQEIDDAGQQHESRWPVDVSRLPIEPVLDGEGRELRIEIPMQNRPLKVRAWRARVGRASLYLLDTNLEENPQDFRALTAQLYGGDEILRLRQELILGIGGVRLLTAAGIEPGVLHLNEGHSAFAPLELARLWATAEGVSFASALRMVAQRTVFTTHTPVSAGHDWFAPRAVLDHLGWLVQEAQIDESELLGYGRIDPTDAAAPFCMTVLALRSSTFANGVSALHGQLSREMWQRLRPGGSPSDVPIGHVTNGVHTASWLAPELLELYRAELDESDADLPWSAEQWTRLESLDDRALWKTHRELKARMIEYVSERCQRGTRDGQPLPPLPFEPDRLTIGFARRFAEYKRSTLLFRDLDRLARLFGDSSRGIQIIFAGKAHPRDGDGKAAIAKIHEVARDARFAGRIAFVEDYDFDIARHLVRGCDVWLNTPRRPLEACGTSGQKALLNGVLNCSILDGWWAEAYDGENGFAIGNGHAHSNWMIQDARDAESLYRVLEREVVPFYYAGDADGVPRRWTGRMKRALATLAWRFSADRMVRDYVTNGYLPGAGGVESGIAHASLGGRSLSR